MVRNVEEKSVKIVSTCVAEGLRSAFPLLPNWMVENMIRKFDEDEFEAVAGDGSTFVVQELTS